MELNVEGDWGIDPVQRVGRHLYQDLALCGFVPLLTLSTLIALLPLLAFHAELA